MSARKLSIEIRITLNGGAGFAGAVDVVGALDAIAVDDADALAVGAATLGDALGAGDG
jgi:hypothetical protein